MVDVAQIKTFVLACELGSLAAVARQEKVSAAAISKKLTKLEEEIGVLLLTRTTRRLELTEIGTMYLEHCHRILEEFEEASSLIAHVKSEPFGSLKVVCGRYFGHQYIVPYLQEFLSRYPKISLNLELAERIPDIHQEGIDILIGMSLPPWGDVIQRKIGATSYVLCGSPDYFKQFGYVHCVDDLKEHRYLAHSMRKPDNQLSFRNQENVLLNPYLRVILIEINKITLLPMIWKLAI